MIKYILFLFFMFIDLFKILLSYIIRTVSYFGLLMISTSYPEELWHIEIVRMLINTYHRQPRYVYRCTLQWIGSPTTFSDDKNALNEEIEHFTAADTIYIKVNISVVLYCA